MKTFIVAIICLAAGYAVAQCVVNRPALPPHANQVIITPRGDGSTTGCTYTATCAGCFGIVHSYPVGNAKCAVVVQMGDLAVGKDNGWDDGGIP